MDDTLANPTVTGEKPAKERFAKAIEEAKAGATALTAEAKARVASAYAFARNSPDPAPEEALQHVYA